jgi:hypothetical protein
VHTAEKEGKARPIVLFPQFVSTQIIHIYRLCITSLVLFFSFFLFSFLVLLVPFTLLAPTE